MLVHKEITKDNELNLYMNGELIYKKWLNTGHSKVFDVMAYDKYTYSSYTDLDIKNPRKLILVNAKLKLKLTEEGGRQSGIQSGYRPNHVFEYKEDGEFKEAYMGRVEFQETKMIGLGIEYEVLVSFPLVQRIERFMDKERKWWIHEGARQVGEAQIINFQLPSLK